MSEWGRLQDVLHDELDRQGYPNADVDALIETIVNVRDFFPGLLGGDSPPNEVSGRHKEPHVCGREGTWAACDFNRYVGKAR